MKRSFRTKVIAVFLIGIVLSMLFMTFLSSIFLRPIFVSNSKKMMENYAKTLEVHLLNETDQVNTLLEEMNISYGITGRVSDAEGNTIYSYSSNNKAEAFLHLNRKLIGYYEEEERDGESYFRERVDESDNIKKITYIRKCDSNHYVIMTKAIKGIEQDIKLVAMFIMFTGVVVAIIGAFTWSIFTKPFTNQIRKMSVITDKMSHLNFDEKINFRSDDEIGILAESIDRLSEELKISIENLQEDVERRKRLVRDISHEMKTPLTTIRGYVDMIQFYTEENEKLKQYCEIAMEECDEIDALVEEMLEMSRLESDGYQCDMEQVFSGEIFEIIKRKTEMEYPDVSFCMDYQNVSIYCNKLLISRAVLNFVKNAVKYRKKESTIYVNGKSENGNYVFQVVNEGAEIPEKERALIWDLFYKNDSARKRDKSHGIGLSMVSQIARLHDGDVRAECESGNTIFSLWFSQENHLQHMNDAGL